MRTLIRERMTDAFVLLPGILKPSEATEQLAAGYYGVILDRDDTPVALIVFEDLKRATTRGAPSLLGPAAGLPPTVIAGGEVQMETLVESGALTLFDVGAQGAVVLDDEGVVGVLPVEVVEEYLGTGEYELPTKTMGPSAAIGDTGLGGAHQTPLGSVVCIALVETKRCGYVNKLAFLDEAHMPMCQNPDLSPHKLDIAP